MLSSVSTSTFLTTPGNCSICNGTVTYVSNTAVVTLSITSCCLSIAGTVAIFVTHLCLPEIRNSTRNLVVCLTVADFLSAAGYLVSGIAYFYGTENDVCFPQSIVTTLSSLVSFFYTVVIAIHIFVSVVCGTKCTSTLYFLVTASIISWLFPAAIVYVAAAKYKALGKSYSVGTGPWCWVADSQSDNTRLWRYLAGKGWEFQCYLVTISLYVLLKFYLYLRQRNRSFSEINHRLREEDRNFLYVWLVLYFLRFWGTARFIITDLKLDAQNEKLENVSQILMYFQAFGDPGQGFGNFILFCVFDKTVRSRFIDYARTFKLVKMFLKAERTLQHMADDSGQEPLIPGTETNNVHTSVSSSRGYCSDHTSSVDSNRYESGYINGDPDLASGCTVVHHSCTKSESDASKLTKSFHLSRNSRENSLLI